MNLYVSDAAIPQIVAIQYGTFRTHFRIRVPPFRYLGCVLQCAVFPHTLVYHTVRSLLLLFQFFLVNLRAPPKLLMKHGPKTTCFLALAKPNRVKTCLRQGASSGALRGRLRRGPLTSLGGPAVHWHMTQPVRTVPYWLELPGPSPKGFSMAGATP